REELEARDGLSLYRDTDRDGVSDYDEKHIYLINPLNAFSGKSALTDGERILLGFDPLSTSTARVPVESPRTRGEEVAGLFEVHAFNVNLRPITPSAAPGTSTPDALPSFREEVTFAGRGLPNGFVTLYIFSTPVVVTVKADISGAWSYTLDTELPDGSHELYVAIVDAGGKIIAKSPAVPFVKEAQAAAFTPLLIPVAPEVSPLDVLQENLVVVGILLFAIFGVLAFIILSGKHAPSAPGSPA
ncbi:MAG: Ig-like domain-containing protein, partial [Patescibacteria group bacterium]